MTGWTPGRVTLTLPPGPRFFNTLVGRTDTQMDGGEFRSHRRSHLKFCRSATTRLISVSEAPTFSLQKSIFKDSIPNNNSRKHCEVPTVAVNAHACGTHVHARARSVSNSSSRFNEPLQMGASVAVKTRQQTRCLCARLPPGEALPRRFDVCVNQSRKRPRGSVCPLCVTPDVARVGDDTWRSLNAP